MPDENAADLPSDGIRAGDQPMKAQAGGLPLRLVGSLPLSDFYHGRRLAVRAFWPRVFLLVGVFVAFAAFFSAIAISAWPYSQQASIRILITVLVAFPLLCLSPAVFLRLKVRRQWRRRTGIFSETETTITEDGVTTQVKSLGISSNCSWDAFTGFRSSERVAVLYFKLGAHMIVSRTKFSTTRDWEAFLALLGNKLTRR
jgi:hypothetical protein